MEIIFARIGSYHPDCGICSNTWDDNRYAAGIYEAVSAEKREENSVGGTGQYLHRCHQGDAVGAAADDYVVHYIFQRKERSVCGCIVVRN